MSLLKSTLVANGDHVTTEIPHEVVQHLGLNPGDVLRWALDERGGYRVSAADDDELIRDASERVLEKYRDTFRKLAES